MGYQQILCPACQSAIAIPPGVTPTSPIQCAQCGQYINPAASFAPPQYTLPQPMSQQQLGPKNKPPVAQPGSMPYGSAGAFGQTAPYQAYAQAPPARGSKLGLIIGLSVGGGVLLAGIAVGVVVLLLNSKPDDVATASKTEHQATTSKEISERGSSSDEPAAVNSDSSNVFGNSISFDQQPQYKPVATGLRYPWKTGDKFAVDFEYDADLRGNHSILAGRVTYEVTDRDPSSVVKKDDGAKQGEGTGTGFVVRPDGYLVTCAHVVQGATKVEAVLGGKTLPAKVVALDVGNDLAIVRVRASGLPYLPLRDSEGVRLAEDVRAFGFPLTDQLGEGIKITRGTVSGISKQEDKKVFQLDVTVNPGNSGGPLVNEQGQVVGVVTSLLAGEQIATMSFAVTSNDVRRLMDRSKLTYELSAEDGQPLSGPDLAERVQRSVALLKVKMGPGGIGIGRNRVVKFSGRWYPYTKTSAGSSRRISGSSVTDSGSILIDETGDVLHCDSDKSFPANMGLVALVGLQRLPGDQSKTWKSARFTAIAQREKQQVPSRRTYSPFDRLPPHMRPPSYSRGRRSPLDRIYGSRTESVETVKVYPALELARYEVTGTSGDTVRIKKSMELATIHAEDETPYIHMEGNGEFQFDKRAGRPKSLDFSAQLAITVNSATVKIPIRLSFKAVDTDVLAKDEEENQKRLEASKRAVAKARAEREALERERDAIPLVRGLDKLDLSPRN